MVGTPGQVGRTLVVGAGVAGIRAALDLAQAGHEAVLVDSSPAIGGILRDLEHQFPDDHCGMCRMLPLVGREVASQHCMRVGLSHPNIRLMPHTHLVGIAGEVGAFEVELLERGDGERSHSLRVDGIILAAGTPLYEPDREELHALFAGSSDVITSIAWEGLSGDPARGYGPALRPSDGRPARRIAWLQCVGSRDPASGRDFCSSVCCMIALKQAVLARRAEVQATIFCMDMRAFGKDHDRYLRRATSEHGVEVVRCRVHEVKPGADGDLRVRYFDEGSGQLEEQEFDLVVLSTGQAPGDGALAKLAGLPVSEATGCPPGAPLERVRSERDGVFLCGSYAGFTDICDAVTSGSAAAGEASRLMLSLGRALVEPEVAPGQTRTVTQRVLVIGGGLAALRATLSLAERGIDVDLVERGSSLPAEATPLGFPWGPSAWREVLQDLAGQAAAHERVTLHPGCRLTGSRGSTGAFESDLVDERGRTSTIAHGATIVATAGREAATSEYGYGGSERVITQAELLRRLDGGAVEPGGVGTVVMIQCVGSRAADGRAYCSRVCCPHALEAALELKERDPEARVLVLARDVMTAGEDEQLYTRARGSGVVFARYVPASPPTVTADGDQPLVAFRDVALQREVRVPADLVVLATGLEPDPRNRELAAALGLEVRDDGFFAEADAKWRPLDAMRTGVFFAGLAHQAQPARDVVAQAEAAAQRAWALLSRVEVAVPDAVATVRHLTCCRCLACVEACPFFARTLDAAGRKVVVDELACQACGLCAVACPNNAAEVTGSEEARTLAGIEAQLEEVLWP